MGGVELSWLFYRLEVGSIVPSRRGGAVGLVGVVAAVLLVAVGPGLVS